MAETSVRRSFLFCEFKNKAVFFIIREEKQALFPCFLKQFQIAFVNILDIKSNFIHLQYFQIPYKGIRNKIKIIIIIGKYFIKLQILYSMLVFTVLLSKITYQKFNV